jgi:hypothetical protein
MTNPQRPESGTPDATGQLLGPAVPAAKTTPRELRRARRQGRRDASSLRPDNRGHLPSTRAFAAATDRVEASIHAALVAAVEKIDAKAARIEAELRAMDASQPPLAVQPPVQDPRAGSPEAQNAARETAEALQRAATADAAAAARYKELTGSAAELIQRRTHLHEAAAALLQTWQAHCRELTEAHRTGYTRALARRFPRPRLMVPDIHLVPTPQHEASHGWASGSQLPFTATATHPGEAPGMHWETLT